VLLGTECVAGSITHARRVLRPDFYLARMARLALIINTVVHVTGDDADTACIGVAIAIHTKTPAFPEDGSGIHLKI